MAKSKNRPSCLSARDRASFAFPTIKDRVPIIVCKIIDLLYRHRSVYPDTDSIKQAIELMSKLRYEIATDKPFSSIEDGREDCSVWNEYKDKMSVPTDQGEVLAPSWFQTSWLYAECYAYRRLWEAMGSTTNPKYRSLDFFEIQKQESFCGSWTSIKALILTVEGIHKSNPKDSGSMAKNFLNLLKVSLWGNKCDLSISSGVATSFQGDPTLQVGALQPNLIVDHSRAVWDHLSANQGGIVDIILDNVGFELVSDLALADYLVSTGLAKKVRIRAKNQPWFVSDAMAHDIKWTINAMETGGDIAQNEEKTNEGKVKATDSTALRWRQFLESGLWEVSEDNFWTYPHFYGEMKEKDPTLYQSLSEAQLLIFKGDLNYRKLVGDLNWDPTTSFEESLLGFHPAPLVTLRTLKADVVTSLDAGQAEELTLKDPKWMINGSWAVIKFCSRIDLI